jgi:ribosomal protein S18 acetylase RimI-like enzyme
MRRVQIATEADIPGWLALAAEVEFLFGPMVNDPGFLNALSNNIKRGSAFCVRVGDAEPGAPLLGGLLFSAKPSQYRIGWLAVAARSRRLGIGSLLIEYALNLVAPPAEVTVVTFGEDNPAGRPARRFYERFGFESVENALNGPEGGARQVFRLRLEPTQEA